jgi:hypothetical protein
VLKRVLPALAFTALLAAAPASAQQGQNINDFPPDFFAPAVPKITTPTGPTSTDTGELVVRGTAWPGIRVVVFEDANNDGKFDASEVNTVITVTRNTDSMDAPWVARHPLRSNSTVSNLKVIGLDVVEGREFVSAAAALPAATQVGPAPERAPALPAVAIQSGAPCRGSYYTQCTDFAGIPIAAGPSVDPAALVQAYVRLEKMLSHREDIRGRMAARGAALVIIPKDSPMTALPEFANLAGRSTSDGRPYSGPQIRGLGGSSGQPASSSAEENLLKLDTDIFHGEDITIHEFAHGVMNVGFSAAELGQWTRIYREEAFADVFTGTYAQVDEDEFWAEMSQVWFRGATVYNAGIGSPEQMAEVAPQAYAFLQAVYGEPAPKDENA